MSKRQRLTQIAQESQVREREPRRGRLWEDGTSEYIQAYRRLLDTRPASKHDVNHLALVLELEQLRIAMPRPLRPTPMPPVVTPFHRFHLLHQRTQTKTSLLHATELLAHRTAMDDELRNRIARYTPPPDDKVGVVIVTSHGDIAVNDGSSFATVNVPAAMHVLRVTPVAPGHETYLSNVDVQVMLRILNNVHRLASAQNVLNIVALYHLLAPFLLDVQDDIQARVDVPSDYVLHYSGMHAMLYGAENAMLNKAYFRMTCDEEKGDKCHVLLLTDSARLEPIMPLKGEQSITTQDIIHTLQTKGYTSCLFLDFSCNTSDDFENDEVDILSSADELYRLAQGKVREKAARKFLLGGSKFY